MTNFFLSDELKRIDIEDDQFIMIPNEVSVDTIDKIAASFSGLTEIQAIKKTILYFVKSWNFKNGESLMPFNEASLDKLRFKFMKLIFNKIIENNEDLKEIMENGKKEIDKKKDVTAN